MFLSDERLTRVGFNFTRPEDTSMIGITQQRLDQYRRMFVDLDLRGGIGADWWVGREAKDTTG